MSRAQWKQTTVGKEIELLYGKSLPESARVKGNIPVYGSNGIVGTHNMAVLDGPGIVVGRKGSVGEVEFSSSPFWPIDTTYYVRNVAGHNWHFLFFLLSSLGLDRLNSHSAVPGLNRESAYALPCAIPPKPEQEKIAAVLWKIQRGIETEETLIATARELKQSAIGQLFTMGLRGEPKKETDIGPMPESWKAVPLGSLGRIGNGSTPLKRNAEYWTNGTIPWLTSAKVYDVTITKADQFVTPKAVEQCHLPHVKPGSVLVAITGQGKTLGHAAVTAIETCVSQHIAYIQFNDEQSINPHFIRLFLESRYEELRAIAQGGGSTKGALTCAFFKSYSVPLPQRREQDEITKALMTIESKIRFNDRKRATLQELFKTLLHQLMTGEIRVADLDIDVSEIQS